MNEVRIGVIGIGPMGRRHCRVYSNLRHAELVGVYDVVPDKSEQIAREYGTVAYRQVDDLLQRHTLLQSCLCMMVKTHDHLDHPISFVEWTKTVHRMIGRLMEKIFP